MDYHFLNGIFHVKSTNLFTDDDYNTLKRIDNTQFFKYLKTKNYGDNSLYKSIGSIIGKEISNIKNEVNSLTRDTLITDVFYLDRDLTNIKIAYKSVFYDVEAYNVDNNAVFTMESLFQFFKHNNKKLILEKYHKLFDDMAKLYRFDIKETLHNIEKTVYGFYSNLIKTDQKYAPLNTYLEHKKSLINLKILLKFRIKNKNVEDFTKVILEETIVGHENWTYMFMLSNKELLVKLAAFFNDNQVKCISDFMANLDTLKLEELIINKMLEVTKRLNYENESIGPIIHFLYLKEIEAFRIRELYYEK